MCVWSFAAVLLLCFHVSKGGKDVSLAGCLCKFPLILINPAHSSPNVSVSVVLLFLSGFILMLTSGLTLSFSTYFTIISTLLFID